MKLYKLIAKIGKEWSSDKHHNTLTVYSYEVTEHPKTYIYSGIERFSKKMIGLIMTSSDARSVTAHTYAIDENLEQLKTEVLNRVKELLQTKIEAVRAFEEWSKEELVVEERKITRS